MKLIFIGVLILFIAYYYFSIQKYIEIHQDEKENFKNINIHKFSVYNAHNYNI
jgi:hypothetical protein